MNAFNRLIMLIIALLLIAVPVFLLLVGFGVLSADQINAVTRYRDGLEALDRLSVSDFDRPTRIVIGIVGGLVALVALLLLLRELTFGRPIARRALIEETPGREIAITSAAVRQLAEAAAREVGADSPSCSLSSEKSRYNIACSIQASGSQNFTETASRTRENIRRVLDEQQVPVENVEITVQTTVS